MKQLDIKTGQFTKEELDTVHKNLKTEKLQALTKHPQKYVRQKI